MIDAATAEALRRIATLERDVRGSYSPGFQPARSDDASSTPRSVPAGDALSAVAPAATYFVEAGPSGERHLTRDGSFVLRDGTLRGSGGAPVLGTAPGRTGLGTLHADPVDVALGRVATAHVAADGTVAYLRTTLDPRNGLPRSERVVLGRVALARLPAGTAVERVDATHVVAPHGVAIDVGAPGERGFGSIVPGARDAGGVDPLRGLARLQEAYLSLEALQAATLAHLGTDKTTMDLLK